MIDILTQKNLEGNLSKIIYWRDSESPNIFYLWPETPRFRRDETGKPVFSFYKYTQDKVDHNGEMKGGYINFDVEFALDDSTVEEARQQLSKKYPEFKDNINIGTITFTDGEIILMAPDNKGFMTKMNTSGKPSLSGRNIATVAMEVTPEGATFLEKALLSSNSSVLQVVYKLSFNTILPAVTARVWYKSDVAYTFVQKLKISGHSCDSGSSYSEKLEKELMDNKAGGFEVNFGDVNVSPEVQNQVRTWGFETLKTMALNSVYKVAFPEGKKGNKNDKIDYAEAVKNSQSFDETMTEKQTINYSLQPCGTLEGLLSVKKPDGSTWKIEDFYQKIDLTDNFFNTLTVCPSFYGLDWDKMKIDNVNITIEYGTGVQDIRRTYSFDKTGELIKSDANPYPYSHTLLHDDKNNPIYEYNYSVTVHFKDGIKPFNSGILKSTDPNISIGPTDIQMLSMDIQTDSLIDWKDKVKSIYLDINCEGTKIPRIEFNKDNTSKHLAYPISTKPKADNYSYDYTITYNMSYGTYTVQGKNDQLYMIIGNLAPETEVYKFMADDDPNVKCVLMSFEYEDMNNNYKQRVDNIDLYTEKNNIYTWQIPVIKTNEGQVYYSGSIIYKNEKPIKTIPRTKAESTTVVVMQGSPKLTIDVSSDLIDWTTYKKVTVRLSYKDEKNGINEVGTLSLTEKQPEQIWKINIADRTKKDYVWSGKFITTDLKMYSTPEVSCSDEQLYVMPPQNEKTLLKTANKLAIEELSIYGLY